MIVIMTHCQSIFITKYGAPPVLQLKSTYLPGPKESEVQIKIEYSGINFADIMSRIGIYKTRLKPPYVPGMEIAGVVVKTGSENFDSMLGKTVVGICKSGGYSSLINVSPEYLFTIKPEWISVAAAIPVNYLTAYFMIIHQGALKKNDTVLIHGIGGGVGIASLQISKKIGAKIIGTSSSGKHQRIKELGVNNLIDYRKEDFYQKVMEFTNGTGVDLVLDPLGGKQLENSYNCLGEFGRLGIYGFSTAVTGKKRNFLKILPKFLKMPSFKPRKLMMKNQGTFGFHLGMINNRIDLIQKYGNILFEWLDQKKIKPEIDCIFDLANAKDAHQYISERKNFGKVLLKS